MKMSKRERKIYNLGKRDGYLDGYKDGLYIDGMIKTINNIGKTLSDPAVIKAIETAKELKEASKDNELGEEAVNNEN